MMKRLWQIFGPILIAGVAAVVLLLAPLQLGRMKKTTIRRASVAMSANVMAGQRLKHQALAENYVPFFGSSELARMDPLHPSTLAAKYHRSYQPFLIGAPGTQSLTHFVNDQTMMSQLRGKKVVFIISLQWFTPKGQRPDAFGFYFSPLQMITWLQQADPNSPADRYAAKRLLKMPVVQDGDSLRGATDAIAHGQHVSSWLQFQLNTRKRMLINEDNLFSRFSVSNNWQKIQNGERQLPATYNVKKLDRLATKIGQRSTTNNNLGIDNQFYAKRLRGNKIKHLRGVQRHLDYERSPEYGDFQLLLDQFARNHVDVQFVIPPINQRWARYTGLSNTMIKTATSKVNYQLHSQGFDHVLDLTQDGGRPYFMQDTIHLGWRGWVRVDQSVDPFLTKPQPKPQYHTSNRFFSTNWANQTSGWGE